MEIVLDTGINMNHKTNESTDKKEHTFYVETVAHITTRNIKCEDMKLNKMNITIK